MILVTGGAWQGKKEFVCQHFHLPQEKVTDGRTFVLEEKGPSGGPAALDQYEALVRRWIKAGADPETMTRRLLDGNPEMILITDEIGCGIIPMDPEEVQYREVHGRLCCRLAQSAGQVYLVECGIGRRIK